MNLNWADPWVVAFVVLMGTQATLLVTLAVLHAERLRREME